MSERTGHVSSLCSVFYTENRLSALLSLQFKHLQISTQKDPDGSPLVLLVEIKSGYEKQFLGTPQVYVRGL